MCSGFPKSKALRHFSFRKGSNFILLLAGVLSILGSSGIASQVSPERLFCEPPNSARPWTYWFWINGNITKEGITQDLEAMAKAGIGGVLIMEVANTNSMAPDGSVKFASPEWRALFKHVVSEAGRLGLEVNMNNDAGWCGSGGPWVKPESSMQKLTSATTNVTGPGHFSGFLGQPKMLQDYYRDIAVLAFPAPKTNTAPVNTGAILDVSDRMDGNGQLMWDIPPGEWQVVRIGTTTTGRKNKPAPASGEGLECNKFDKAALKQHFDAFIKVLAKDVGPATGKAFSLTHIDSWEVGGQDWTAKMPQEFKKRRGYDLMPWMPVLAGKWTVQGLEETRRFRRDFKRTCAELLLENYAGALRDLAHRRGLQLSIEAYGTAGFLNPLEYAGECDLPMSEFWINRWAAWHLLSSRLLASAAHAYGNPIVGAEAFTSWAEADPYTEHPYSVKTTGDWAFCEGVNRMVFHRSVLQPWGRQYLPGMSFAGYGWHADCNQTWWQDFSGYLMYLSRCQALLQRGTFVADVCRLVPDGENYGNSPNMSRLPTLFESLPPGYGYDYISDRVLGQMSVSKGRLVAPSGMTYSVLQLARTNECTPEVMQILGRLVKSGAVITGGRPNQSPSLQDFPRCDEKVRGYAAEIWGKTDGGRGTLNRLGKGLAMEGAPLDEFLRGVAGGPDFRFSVDPLMTDESIMSVTQGRGVKHGKEPLGLMPTDGLNWIHKQIRSTEFYFIANPQHRTVRALCEFRVAGLQPELWDPMTGTTVFQPVFRETVSGTTIVPIEFDSAGSVFVVFRRPSAPASTIVEVRSEGQVLFGSAAREPRPMPDLFWADGRLEVRNTQHGTFTVIHKDGRTQIVSSKAPPSALEITGPWRVEFQPNRGAPASADFRDLADWSTNSEPGIRYFSGTATYRTAFEWSPPSGVEDVTLNLGDLRVTARVTLNGKDLGILWKPPFKVAVSSALKSGKNDLEVKITNLWANRLIGDEQYPDDCTPDGSWKSGPLKAWPVWFAKGLPRPEPRRITFTTWKHYGKDSALLPSGLLGPVTLQPILK